MRSNSLKFVLIGAVLVTTSCATILKDKNHKINVITSNNKRAKVQIDGASYDVPGVINVSRQKENKTLESKTSGCSSVAMESTVEPVFFVNILSGGTFGSTTDYSTGNMWKYQDNIVLPCTKE